MNNRIEEIERRTEIKEAGINMDLSFIQIPRLREYAIEGIKNKDIGPTLAGLNSENKIEFIFYNRYPLLQLGVYEEVLLNAFIATKTNYVHCTLDLMKSFFYAADKEKLMACGDPLPEKKEAYTLYRGVSGHGANRRKRSVSWTASFGVAQWFAQKSLYSKPMVYKAIVPRANIFAYTNERDEEEFICDISDNIKLIEVWRNDDPIEYKQFLNPVWVKDSGTL